MSNIKKALTLYYTEGVILIMIYDDGSIVITDHEGNSHNFGKRNQAASWFKKEYKSTLCF